MSDLEPVTNVEKLLDGQDLEPTTRKEMFIKRIYDKTQPIPVGCVLVAGLTPTTGGLCTLLAA